MPESFSELTWQKDSCTTRTAGGADLRDRGCELGVSNVLVLAGFEFVASCFVLSLVTVIEFCEPSVERFDSGRSAPSTVLVHGATGGGIVAAEDCRSSLLVTRDCEPFELSPESCFSVNVDVEASSGIWGLWGLSGRWELPSVELLRRCLSCSPHSLQILSSSRMNSFIP